MSDLKICVLGSGVIGLTTAIELRKEFRNSSIDIIADAFYSGTTSFVAAGLFLPIESNSGGSVERTSAWVKDSYNYWENIRALSESEEIGIRHLSGHILLNRSYNEESKALESLIPELRPLSEEELKFWPGNWKYGKYCTTLQIDPSRYLKWALYKVKELNINIIQRKITDFGQLTDGNYDVIANCTGIGAKVLCEDNELFALRGQVSLVKAPWVKNFVLDGNDCDTYIIPSFDNIVLGGCRHFESYNLAPNHYDALSMREKCEHLIPSLKNATLVEHKVGLRPFRLVTRVEQEYKPCSGRNMKIVHNYGHGGSGITLAPGTSLNAVQLVKDILIERRSKM
ncbi:hypothetical protein WA026_016615 [Henosepilachna vigintioctopunctata]|uniref:FAD dependent oxidoreductase domain-containing protein n=1 Tax=Henosepilachna vigintioctopunctata TaxID=420089 RepID=A0AAW1VFQ2_9CUCU